MSDSRSAILARLSGIFGREARPDEPAVSARIREHGRGPQPQWAEAPRERLAQAVADYVAKENLPQRLSVAPHPLLEAIDWPAAWQIARGRAQGEDRVSLAVAFCGIAETGSLMLLSGPDSPTTLNFLPDDFLCVLPEARIVPRMEDAWALLRAERESLPRATNIVTGPSRTADVEQTIQLGAHGPRRLHVLLLASAA